MFYPGYAEFAELPPVERRAKLAEPAVRAKILESPPVIPEGLPAPAMLLSSGFHMMYPLGDPPDYEPAPDKSVGRGTS